MADKDLYSLVEAAQELDVSVEELRSIISFRQWNVTKANGQELLAKEDVDSFFSYRTSAVKDKQKKALTEEHFTLEHVSHALRESTTIVKRNFKVETINGQQLVSRREVERGISKRDPLQQKTIRRRLPKPLQIDKQNIETPETKQEKQDQKSLQQPIHTTNKMQEQTEALEKTSPALPEDYASKLVELEGWVNDLQEELGVEREENSKLTADIEEKDFQQSSAASAFEIRMKKLQSEKESTISAFQSVVERLHEEKQNLVTELEAEESRRSKAEDLLQQLRQQLEEEEFDLLSDLSGRVRDLFGRPTESERVRKLEEEIRSLRVTLKTNEAYLESELERERKSHAQDRQDIRYERDHIEAEMENLRRDGEVQAARIEEEKRLRQDAQLRAQEYYSELEQLRDSRETLNQSEATRKNLEKTLSREKEKSSRLEAEASLLAKVRSLLEGNLEQMHKEVESVPIMSAPVAEDVETIESSPTILIDTRFGRIIEFRPPFELSFREVELLKLVAGEDEITGEQIRSRLGRKRAVDDLDELLDKLHEYDLEPIKEDRGRYSFDREFLHDE